MKEIVERFVKETDKYTYTAFMNWLYATNWDSGLDILDDHLYQEEVKLLLEMYKDEKTKQ